MSRIDRDKQIRVLHVDDDEALCDLVQSFVGRLADDMTVLTETTPEDGLERLEEVPVDCVVSDYEMPGLDGLAFLQAVRENYPNLPFILFTGKGSEEIASTAIDRGVTFYLRKRGTESYELLANRIRIGVERHRSERHAEVARDRLLRMFEQTDGFFVLDDSERVTYWSQQMEQRTGYPAEEVTGSRFLEAFPEAAGTDLYDHYRTAMDEGTPQEFETYYEPHGYWVEVRAYPVEEGLFVHSREISEEVRNRREIEQRNRILESFANTVSHDLRNPLNVAQGKLELARRTGDSEHLTEVAQAHDRMRNLIDELLRIARDQDPEFETVSLEARATEAWKTVPTEGLRLDVEDDLTLEAFPEQLGRLFENLYWNTLDHARADRVRVGPLGRRGFYVADDGVGIPATRRDDVFESGFSTADEGSGYGLTIVASIAEAQGWDVDVTSSEEGGARFEFENVTVLDAD